MEKKNGKRTIDISIKANIPTLLTLLFSILKLTGMIHWTWIWVLSPLWIGMIIGLVLLAIAGILIALE